MKTNAHRGKTNGTATVLETTTIPSPFGQLTLAMHDGKLAALTFTDCWPEIRAALERRLGRVEYRSVKQPTSIAAALRAYFHGDLAALEQIPIAPTGTPFQQRVWRALRRIPPGRTSTYAELARKIGAPSAARAVGGASAANPVWIVIPCHRLVAADGGLGGYAGGVARKQHLLTHEVSPPRVIPRA